MNSVSSTLGAACPAIYFLAIFSFILKFPAFVIFGFWITCDPKLRHGVNNDENSSSFQKLYVEIKQKKIMADYILVEN